MNDKCLKKQIYRMDVNKMRKKIGSNDQDVFIPRFFNECTKRADFDY